MSNVFKGSISVESDIIKGNVTFRFASANPTFGLYIEVSEQTAKEIRHGLKLVLQKKSWGYDIEAKSDGDLQ